MIKIKRVYEKAEKDNGTRVLVDRLWPRGLKKEEARIDVWMKEVASSNRLRNWFSHQEKRWPEFKTRYFKELKGKKELTDRLKRMSQGGVLTLLFAAKDETANNAAALKEFIEGELKNDR